MFFFPFIVNIFCQSLFFFKFKNVEIGYIKLNLQYLTTYGNKSNISKYLDNAPLFMYACKQIHFQLRIVA